MSIFDAQRRLIVEHKFLLGDASVPAFCALSRLELHKILLGVAERAGAEIRLGVTTSQIHDEKDRVEVQLSNGRSETFDLLVGFDGIRSSTREHLVGTAFVPRPSGFGAWRVQVRRPHYVRGMEFLQGIGSKTGAMPLNNDLMYVFHIRPEAPDAWFDQKQFAQLLKERMAQYGSYVAQISRSLDADSEIVYSPMEPLLLPWPWFRGRVVIGGDAAHTFPPHLTQGAAMAAEDAYVLAREMVTGEGTVADRLMRYSKDRYARCAFVYIFLASGSTMNSQFVRPLKWRVPGPRLQQMLRQELPQATVFSIARSDARWRQHCPAVDYCQDLERRALVALTFLPSRI